MKTTLVLLLGTVLSSQAAIVHFDLSPAGSDTAVGLSPSNQVPVAAGSAGSGNEISGGIVFDTDSSKLSLAIGYGSAAGFANLTGPATAMHIHGPAGAGTNANVLVDLSPYHFAAANPTNGGIIFGILDVPTNEVANLLAGLLYINIHTAEFTNGEIRGQLVAVASTNEPPSITCPGDSTVVCNVPTELTVLVSDPEGDALQMVWYVNGAAMQTNAIPASNPPAAANVSFTTTFPFGTNSVGVTVTDSATNQVSCGTTVTVMDTNPPVIVSASASPNVLWPPNHRMVLVQVHADVVDDCSATTWKIIGVTSNEDVNARGSGNTAPDWQICSDHAVKLRAERAGSGSGRIYTITIQATDGGGNVSQTRNVTVTVPHSQGNGNGHGGNGNGNGNGNGHGNGNGNGNGHGNK